MVSVRLHLEIARCRWQITQDTSPVSETHVVPELTAGVAAVCRHPVPVRRFTDILPNTFSVLKVPSVPALGSSVPLIESHLALLQGLRLGPSNAAPVLQTHAVRVPTIRMSTIRRSLEVPCSLKQFTTPSSFTTSSPFSGSSSSSFTISSSFTPSAEFTPIDFTPWDGDEFPPAGTLDDETFVSVCVRQDEQVRTECQGQREWLDSLRSSHIVPWFGIYFAHPNNVSEVLAERTAGDLLTVLAYGNVTLDPSVLPRAFTMRVNGCPENSWLGWRSPARRVKRLMATAGASLRAMGLTTTYPTVQLACNASWTGKVTALALEGSVTMENDCAVDVLFLSDARGEMRMAGVTLGNVKWLEIGYLSTTVDGYKEVNNGSPPYCHVSDVGFVDHVGDDLPLASWRIGFYSNGLNLSRSATAPRIFIGGNWQSGNLSIICTTTRSIFALYFFLEIGPACIPARSNTAST